MTYRFFSLFGGICVGLCQVPSRSLRHFSRFLDSQGFLKDPDALSHTLVNLQVFNEEIVGFAILAALFANILLVYLVLVFHQVLIQIGLLGEGLSAAWSGTDERALSGMYAQVVEEVAPLPRVETTGLEVTFHYSDEAPRRRVLELVNTEVLCLWNGPVLLIRCLVVGKLIVAVQDFDLATIDGNLLPDLRVVNLFAAKD